MKFAKPYLIIMLIGTSIIFALSYAGAENSGGLLSSSILSGFVWSITPIGFLYVAYSNSSEPVFFLRVLKSILLSLVLTAMWFFPAAIVSFQAHVWGGGLI
ncbi:MAG: hypothetical protein V7765_15005 [Oleispira sp.]